MSMYYVFVCPKCQRHSQLFQPGSKTVGCQNCRARIQIEKLRVFGPFETHEEAVENRAKIQAELVNSSSNAALFSEKSADFSASAIGKEIKTAPPKIKKPQQIIREVLLENGKMIVADCEYYCAERGIDSDTFQKIIQKMIEAGEVYRPDKGLLKLID
jgi:hypothetical protein